MTRAIIIATELESALRSNYSQPPRMMLPLVDRPFIQQVIEYLAGQGMTEFDFILCDHAERIESLLGDGTRWGVKCRYHLTRDPRRPYETLKRIAETAGDQPLLLGHADRLPEMKLDHEAESSVLYYWLDPTIKPAGDQAQWTGWATLPPSRISALPNGLNEHKLEANLIALFSREGVIRKTSRLLSAESHGKLLGAQREVLTGEFTGLLFTGKESSPGIRIGRRARIHPEVKLIAPVFVGENCLVEKGVTLGPNTVIGAESIVDQGAILTNTLVAPRSCIGEYMQLNNAVVSGGSLINAPMGVEVALPDDYQIAPLSTEALRQKMAGGLARLFAVLLLILACPLILALGLLKLFRQEGQLWQSREVISLPASEDETEWRTFKLWSFAPHGHCRSHRTGIFGIISFTLLELLPRLRNVISGELNFFGVYPRTWEEIGQLPEEWRPFYLSQRAGCFNSKTFHLDVMPHDVINLVEIVDRRYVH